jgi:hypothetical protein
LIFFLFHPPALSLISLASDTVIDYLTLKHTNKLKGIVSTTSTQDRKIKIFPQPAASPLSLSASSATTPSNDNYLQWIFKRDLWNSLPFSSEYRQSAKLKSNKSGTA